MFLIALVSVSWTAIPASIAAAQDVVHILAEPGSELGARLTGEVVDFTGRELILKRPGGVEQRYPAARVAEVETTRTAEQLAARRLMAEHKYEEAARQLEAAEALERRDWVRREILAETVWCLRELDDDAGAGGAFLALVASDHETFYFDAIPLAWVTAQPSPELERRSEQWLADDRSAAAGLLGASHLLPTQRRTAAVARLKRLLVDPDPRIRALATAQLWRTDTVTVADEEVAARLTDLEKFPEGLRGGPALVLGQALAARQEPLRAAMWLLRLPLVDGRPRRLAARALFDAAVSLERVGQQADAAVLYHELVDAYANAPEAGPARQRLAAVEAAAASTEPPTAE